MITWQFNSEEDKRHLKESGISEKIVDILDSQKTFDHIFEHTKNLYKVFRASYMQKILLLSRGKNKLKEKDYFYTTPIHTSYQTDLYSRLIKALQDNGVQSNEYKQLSAQWAKYPCFISIGHNPQLYARKVKNIKIYEIQDSFSQTLQWEEPLINDSSKLELHSC